MSINIESVVSELGDISPLVFGSILIAITLLKLIVIRSDSIKIKENELKIHERMKEIIQLQKQIELLSDTDIKKLELEQQKKTFENLLLSYEKRYNLSNMNAGRSKGGVEKILEYITNREQVISPKKEKLQ